MRLHLVDGTFELFRAHYSKRPSHRDRQGRDLKATVGLASSLLALLHDPEEAPSHVAVAFDNPIESFRNALFAGYKTGAGIDPDLRAQFDLAEEAVAAIGVRVWRMDRWEADDALATASTRWADAVEQVRILTPDKDLAQVVRGERVVQVDRMRSRVIDEEGVHAKYGVPPAAIPAFLALVGDTADGIPGLPGFGEKTASALLRAFGTIEDIPDDPDAWPRVRGAAGLAATLSARRADAVLYQRLATLVTDVPLPDALEDLRFGGVPRSDWARWCDGVDATARLRDRPVRWG